MNPICSLDELAEGACREFDLVGHACFLLRHEGRILAYRNYCPHRGVTLNWSPNDFFAATGDELRCATHDARFRVEDGHCVSGPCAGASLVPLSVVVIDGSCFVITPPE